MNSKLITGYHNEEALNPIKGGEKSVEDLFMPSQMHIEIVLKKDSHGLLIEANEIQDSSSLIGALFGTFTGLMTIFCLLMWITENLCLTKISKTKATLLKDIIYTRIYFDNIFKSIPLNYIEDEHIRHFNGSSNTDNNKI